MSSYDEVEFTSNQHQLDRTNNNKGMQKLVKNSERQSFSRSSMQETECLNCERDSSPKRSSTLSRISSLHSSPCFTQTRCRISTPLNIFSSRSIFAVVILALATLTSGSSIMKSECDPSDANSCKYGGRCELEQSRSRQGTPYYRCVCPQINCFKSGLYDPVCGERQGRKEQYYNVLCLMLEECSLQQPIRQNCYGLCGKDSCRAITSENLHHSTCPPEDAALCQNGGLCVYHTHLKESTCRCPSDFTGDRCESKKPPTLEDQKDKDSTCDSRREMLTIFAIVLLALVLVLIVVCMCWRSRGNKKGDDVSLWDSKDTEREETTPLRESKRSDYLFPENERKGIEK